jgi:hypothetical protein
MMAQFAFPVIQWGAEIQPLILINGRLLHFDSCLFIKVNIHLTLPFFSCLFIGIMCDIFYDVYVEELDAFSDF